MIINRIFTVGCICVLLVIFSHPSIAGLGDGTAGSPNPTGGFGQSSKNTSTAPNPTGGFALGTGGDMPLEEPPPPPPEPVPLDGGVFLLIAASLGLGIKKIYTGIKNQ